MGALLHPTLIVQVVRHLPKWLVRPLDAWSYRLAQRRAQQRHQKWLARQAAAKSGTA